jgi:hypothetical protein
MDPGCQDDLGGGAHGAALGEVAEDAALVVGDRQVQVGAVPLQDAGERDDLHRGLPGGVLGAIGARRRAIVRMPRGYRRHGSASRDKYLPEWHQPAGALVGGVPLADRSVQ